MDSRPAMPPRPLHLLRVLVMAAALPLVVTAAPLAAQSTAVVTTAGDSLPLTLAGAVELALANGAPAAVARADLAAARAGLTIARARPNPTVAASYTESAPQYHMIVDLPFDYPWMRRPRIGAATAGLSAASAQGAFVRATVRYDVAVAYTAALATGERAALSRRTARDADSLVTMATVRRSAGDASDLDVELAQVNAIQLENVAAADSMRAIGALLDLQLRLGLRADAVTVTLVDSLIPLPDSSAAPISPTTRRGSRANGGIALVRPPAPATAMNSSGGPIDPARRPASAPLRVAAAEASLVAQSQGVLLARRRGALYPSLQVGIEGRDPTGGPAGPLAVLGVALPLPLFNQYRGDLALAEAGRQRAEAELGAAQRESDAAVTRALREQAAARARVRRGETGVATARALAAKALTAYREGASALPEVLSLQRSARDALAQYVDDVAALRAAAAAIQLATATSSTP